MIVQRHRSWFSLILTSKGSILPRIWRRLAATFGVATLFTALHELQPFSHLLLTALPFTLIGLALSIFLGFRNNASYDRFWEGRKLWGELVNTSRSQARQILILLPATPEAAEAKRQLVHRLIGFGHALRLHLREQPIEEELRPWLSENELKSLERETNRPSALLHVQAEHLRTLWEKGWLHPYHLALIEGGNTALTTVLGGCERIKNTPLPFAYSTLLHRIVAFYCFALPLGILKDVGLITPLVTVMVSYAFFGLDAIGDEIENPFGTDANDLPLSAITRNLEINLLQRLGETDLPAPLQPVEDVLS